MASMEECLDITLITLKKNWDKDNNKREELKPEELLKEYGLPERYRKHEFFIRIINRLVKDGYVEVQGLHEMYMYDFDRYKATAIITIEGFFFIQNGGYKQQEKDKKFDRHFTRVSVTLLTIATIIAAIYYGIEIFHSKTNETDKTVGIKDPDTLKIKVLQLPILKIDTAYLKVKQPN